MILFIFHNYINIWFVPSEERKNAKKGVILHSKDNRIHQESYLNEDQYVILLERFSFYSSTLICFTENVSAKPFLSFLTDV